MIAPAAAVAAPPRTATPTIWGCTPRQAHDRFWAAFGVQVVRRQERSEIVAGAELFLLCDPDALVLFRPAQVLDTLYWLDPKLLCLRLKDGRPRPYREVVVTDRDRLVRFERVYRDHRGRSARVALTPDHELANAWQNTGDERSAWKSLIRRAGKGRVVVRSAEARVYDGRDDAQVMECTRDVLNCWERPDTTIGRVQRVAPGVWADRSAAIGRTATFDGPIWVGAGRQIEERAYVVGPAVLWDDPASRAEPDEVQWQELEPTSLSAAARRVRGRRIPGKRAFDVLFSSAALLATAPLYPIVALAILIEDGRPIFFAHRRETQGGREFPCLKFRSMRKGADLAKAELARRNLCDGPQFFMKDDPRVTRVGRILRKLQIDELPQFVNVLLGHMSVVGPRPSPYRENQYCPAWREARLSVRPGITGLWQVSRTRRTGLDFQEWIRFDLEYVRKAGWALDLKIIWRTLRVVVGGMK